MSQVNHEEEETINSIAKGILMANINFRKFIKIVFYLMNFAKMDFNWLLMYLEKYEEFLWRLVFESAFKV